MDRNIDVEAFLGIDNIDDRMVSDIYQTLKHETSGNKKVVRLGDGMNDDNDLWISQALIDDGTISIEECHNGEYIVNMPYWFAKASSNSLL